MNQLVLALRQRTPMFANSFISSSQSLAIRGPKKKKGPEKSTVPDNTDIVNIFKDRKDAIIHSTDRYPPWLVNLLEEHYTPDDVVLQIYRGERIPTDYEQWSLAKSFRRQYMNDQNRLFRNDWNYESEDDIGEDIGKFEEEEAENLEAGAEGGAAGAEGTGAAAAGGAKKEGEGAAAGGGGDKGDKDKK